MSHFYTVGIRFIYIDISTVDLSILMNITYIDITVVKSCLRPESAPVLFFWASPLHGWQQNIKKTSDASEIAILQEFLIFSISAQKYNFCYRVTV